METNKLLARATHHLLEIPNNLPLVIRDEHLMIDVQRLHNLPLVPFLLARSVREGRQRKRDRQRGQRAPVRVRDASVDDDDLAPAPGDDFLPTSQLKLMTLGHNQQRLRYVLENQVCGP